MEQLRFIVKFLLSLVVSPEQTWCYLTDRTMREADSDYVYRNYYLPMMGAVAAFIFVLTGWHDGSFSLEVAMKAGTAFLVAFFAGPYVAEFVMQRFAQRFYDLTLDRSRLRLFVLYALSYEMAVALLSVLLARFRFADLLVIYLAYIVWCATEVYFVVDDRRRLSFSLWTTALLFLSHWSISTVLTLMGG